MCHSSLVRPLSSPYSTAFKEVPLTKSSLEDGITRVLLLIDDNADKRLHSFRRGEDVLQHQAGVTRKKSSCWQHQGL